MCVCVCVCVYMKVHTHTHTHTHPKGCYKAKVNKTLWKEALWKAQAVPDLSSPALSCYSHSRGEILARKALLTLAWGPGQSQRLGLSLSISLVDSSVTVVGLQMDRQFSGLALLPD